MGMISGSWPPISLSPVAKLLKKCKDVAKDCATITVTATSLKA
jgi:hypothetical protein